MSWISMLLALKPGSQAVMSLATQNVDPWVSSTLSPESLLDVFWFCTWIRCILMILHFNMRSFICTFKLRCPALGGPAPASWAFSLPMEWGITRANWLIYAEPAPFLFYTTFWETMTLEFLPKKTQVCLRAHVGLTPEGWLHNKYVCICLHTGIKLCQSWMEPSVEIPLPCHII